MAQLTVMIVDDNAAICDSVGMLIEDSGFRVVRAHDGLHALELYETDSPDVVVTDLRMPRLGGVALAERLRATCPSLPIVLITAGYDGPEDLSQIGEVLLKPFAIAELNAAIQRAVAH